MFLMRLYTNVSATVQKLAGDWFLGLAARLVFASTLLLFFLNSAKTKVGSDFPDMFIPQAGAYAQMLPPVAEAAGYDSSQIAFLPYGLIVWAGTYAEFILPLAVVFGLLTRLSALAMIGFIFVMSYVDVMFHGIGDKAVGAPFDRLPDAIISDQRLLWLFPLVYLVIRGAGMFSLDALLCRFRGCRHGSV